VLLLILGIYLGVISDERPQYDIVILFFFYPLTPTEKAFVDGTRQFTNAQKRYIRFRLNEKLSLLNTELRELQQRCCNVAASERDCSNGKGASLVRIPPQIRRWIIVNERVKNSKWAGRNLNPRSPPCQGSSN
jgi:hypothetical protein